MAQIQQQQGQPRQWRWSDYEDDDDYDDLEGAIIHSNGSNDQQWQQQQQHLDGDEAEGDSVDGDALANGYQMLEELGSGSFGVVYKAIQKATGEIVAIKHVDLESSEEDITDIQAEIAVLSSCASPFVTQYKTAFLRAQKLWIVMEYLGGGSCQDLLKPGTFAESHIAIIMRELLLGLAYLHSEGKLHRDIKAANVLLSNSGKVKLADFGVAAQLTNIKSLRNTFVGTPFWMAPEVIQQAGHDFKADVWSLGITAMELVNGEPPHAATHPMKVLFVIPKAPAPKLEGSQYSKDFRDFVASCLVKDPEKRPSAKELLKHRFVRNAGKVESLQELIIRRQEWEAGQGGGRNLRYYAETLRSLQRPTALGGSADADDGWVFDTVKPATAATAAPPTQNDGTMKLIGTQKRRKVTADRLGVDVAEDAVAAIEGLSLQSQTQTPRRQSLDQEMSSTMRKVSASAQKERVHSPTPSVRKSTRKRVTSAQQKQPLGVNMSFGNSPSTVRQFRRVSPNAENAELVVGKTKTQQPPVPNERSALDRMSPPALPGFSSTATTIVPESKELSLGKRVYANAVGISCQEVLNNTGDQEKREAVARVAEAFSDLETVDPEGMYHIMKGILEKMGKDSKLAQLLPQPPNPNITGRSNTPPSSQPHSQASTINSKSNISTGTVVTTPQKEKANAAKLVMAQNNPHLKSHRRRQSAQVVSRNPSAAGEMWPSSPKTSEEKEILKLMPGQGKAGLEHTRVLGDVLFDRWCEGLRMRWPAV